MTTLIWTLFSFWILNLFDPHGVAVSYMNGCFCVCLQVLSYLVACDHLCQLGYDMALVEEALEMFQNCETKVRHAQVFLLHRDNDTLHFSFDTVTFIDTIVLKKPNGVFLLRQRSSFICWVSSMRWASSRTPSKKCCWCMKTTESVRWRSWWCVWRDISAHTRTHTHRANVLFTIGEYEQPVVKTQRESKHINIIRAGDGRGLHSGKVFCWYITLYGWWWWYAIVHSLVPVCQQCVNVAELVWSVYLSSCNCDRFIKQVSWKSTTAVFFFNYHSCDSLNAICSFLFCPPLCSGLI